MTTEPSNLRVDAASKVAAQLRAEGRVFEADQVDKIVRTYGASRRTNSLLYRENMDLRAQINALRTRLVDIRTGATAAQPGAEADTAAPRTAPRW